MLKAKKHPSPFRYLLRRTILYATATFLMLTAIIAAQNAAIVTHAPEQGEVPTPSPAADTPAAPMSTPALTTAPAEGSTFMLMSLPSDASHIVFSYDGKYCVCMSGGKIVVIDILTDQILRTLQAKEPITQIMLLNNQDIVLYFVLNSAGRQLGIYTFNIVTEKTAQQKVIPVSKGDTLKQVGYAASMSAVFFNIESGSGKTAVDHLEYLNINKSLKPISTNKRIVENIVPLNKQMALYYVDSSNKLYCHSKHVPGFEAKNVRLLGCDKSDNIYVQSLDQKDTIYVLNQEKISGTITLAGGDTSTIYADNSNVYAVYENYIVNLSGDAASRQDFDASLKFLGTGGDRFYFTYGNKRFFCVKSTIS